MSGLDRGELDAMQERADAATFVGGDMQVLAEDVLDLLDEVRRLSDALAEAEQDRDAFSRISKRAIGRAERAEAALAEVRALDDLAGGGWVRMERVRAILDRHQGGEA